jgi:hypothetical protein
VPVRYHRFEIIRFGIVVPVRYHRFVSEY